MDGLMIGWRDGILILVALAAFYLVFMLVKLTQLGRRSRSSPAGRSRVASADNRLGLNEPAVEPQAGPDLAPSSLAQGRPEHEWDKVRALLGAGPEETPVVASPAPPQGTGFGEHIAQHLARADMEMEVQRMKSEMERMRTEMEEMRTASRVSPQYAEAMALAQRGLSPQDLADRLEISLGEAELVHALSRNEQNFDEGEDHGAEPFAAGHHEFGRRTG